MNFAAQLALVSAILSALFLVYACICKSRWMAGIAVPLLLVCGLMYYVIRFIGMAPVLM